MASSDDAAAALRPVRAVLPRLYPLAAARRNALLALLHGAPVEGGGELEARVLDAIPSGPVLRFRNGLAVRPLVADGRPCAWLPDTSSAVLPEALVELSALEPLLAAVERAWGVALEPDALASTAPPGAIPVRLEAGASGGPPHQAAVLVVPVEAAPPPARRRASTVSRLGPAAAARVACRLDLDGPLAPARELSALAPGDLVLAPGRRGALRGCLRAGKGAAAGIWRPADATFTCEDRMLEPDRDGDDPRAAPAAATGGEAGLPADVPVRLRLELASVELPLGELAALAPGSVVAAPLAGDAPAVTLTAHGVVVATGRLMALGDGYGVLVDTVAAAARGGAPA